METTGPDAGGVVAVLVGAGRTIELGWLERGERCGLGFLDDLLRLQLALGRVGWRLHLEATDPELTELLSLVGLSTLL